MTIVNAADAATNCARSCIASKMPSKGRRSTTCIGAAVTLFDRNNIPKHVVSQAGVDRVNAVAERLRGRLVEAVALQESGSTFRLTNMIRCCNQSFIRRSLHFAEAGALLIDRQYGLAGTVMARCMFETVACYRDFQNTVVTLVGGLRTLDDLKKLHEYVHGFGFATRLEDLISLTGSENVKAKSILTQIDKMKPDQESVRSDYDYLCEYAHPNALGTLVYFGVRDNATDTMSFSALGQAFEDDYKWMFVGARLLEHFESYLNNVEDCLPALSESGRKLSTHLPT